MLKRLMRPEESGNEGEKDKHVRIRFSFLSVWMELTIAKFQHGKVSINFRSVSSRLIMKTLSSADKITLSLLSETKRSTEMQDRVETLLLYEASLCLISV